MHCGVCEDYWEDDHDTHELVDQGECLALAWFQDDVLESFDGGDAPLRSGPVSFDWQGDYYTWAYDDTGSIVTDAAILSDVADERDRQDAKWGAPVDHPDGSGPEEMVLLEMGFHAAEYRTAGDLAEMAQLACRSAFDGRGSRPGTWADILLEEVFEALAEDDPEKLRTELVQVAAVSVKWARMIDAREGVTA
ncbi:hypothetical protein [Microbacterium arborescens]